jgi:copper chaperone
MKYRFKTNLKCSGCVEKITPYLEANNEIKSWHVDLESPEKILTIEADHIPDELMYTIMRSAGYSSERLPE